MRKMSMFFIVFLLVLSPTALAKKEVQFSDADQKQNSSSLNYTIEVREKNSEKLEKVKADSDFEVVYQDDSGNFMVVPSENVKSKDDFARFQSKLNEFSVQGTNTVRGSHAIPYRGEYLVQQFTDTVWDSDWWFGDEEIKVNGVSYTGWCLDSNCLMSGPTLNYWTSLQSQVDTFVFNYSYVSSTSGSVTVAPAPGASTSWTVLNTSATYAINWPNMGQGNFTHRTYGEVFLKTDNITGYTHSSSAIASSPGVGQIYVAANEYIPIS